LKGTQIIENLNGRTILSQETTAMYRAQKQMSLGLGNTNGEEWYRLRRASQQRLLRPKEVGKHMPAVAIVAEDFSRRLTRVRYSPTGEVNDLKTEVSGSMAVKVQYYHHR